MFRRFDIDLAPFLNDIYDRTLHVEGRISRDEALRRLNHAGVLLSDIVGMYREGENSPWNVVLETKEKASNINSEGIKYLAKMVIDLHVHWLPLYISDMLIEEVLRPFGKVLDISKDKTLLDKDTMTLNGTRNVKLQTTEFDSRHIPHIVSLGQCGMLITMKGRPPICLKCRQSGHLRKDCPEKTSYASVTTSRKSPQLSTPIPPVPATPAPQVLSPLETTSPVIQPSTAEPTSPVVEDVPEVKDEIVIATSSQAENTTPEKRSELFDVDSGTWEVVRKNKRIKTSSITEDDNLMDTSQAKS
ncbi:hypothetical protein ACJMK2_035595 [Sinanodonta woodiana]|uniref:CCHC-type domain-containing protein n=1 Tax=Sinanodonta woodiana TaxID=1069815 RepID=A0ABD3WVE7_SINWO